MPRRLKVFLAQFGFYDCVVAAPSQAAALRLWGAHQNLFSDGQARLATDETAIAAALAQPEVPLRRAIGSNDPFSLQPRLPRLPDLPDLTPKPRSRSTAVATLAPKSRPKPAPEPVPPDRTALDAAEAALKTLDERRRQQEAAFRDRRAALDAEELAAKIHHATARSRAEEVVTREQQAFRKASRRDERDR